MIRFDRFASWLRERQPTTSSAITTQHQKKLNDWNLNSRKLRLSLARSPFYVAIQSEKLHVNKNDASKRAMISNWIARAQLNCSIAGQMIIKCISNWSVLVQVLDDLIQWVESWVCDHCSMIFQYSPFEPLQFFLDSLLRCSAKYLEIFLIQKFYQKKKRFSLAIVTVVNRILQDSRSVLLVALTE